MRKTLFPLIAAQKNGGKLNNYRHSERFFLGNRKSVGCDACQKIYRPPNMKFWQKLDQSY